MGDPHGGHVVMTTRPVTELATSETVDGEPRAPDVGVSTPIRTFLVAVSVYLVAVVAFGLWMSDRSGGHFTYALDDPYIHLAMADNLAFHGTWGVDPGVYESASSSPAWTVLTAAGMIVLPIPDLWVPLVLNVAAGAWIICCTQRWRWRSWSGRPRCSTTRRRGSAASSSG